MSELRREVNGNVLHLIIDREDKRNSLSREVLQGLLDGVRSVGDEEVSISQVKNDGGFPVKFRSGR